jgi:hypothetical protein
MSGHSKNEHDFTIIKGIVRGDVAKFYNEFSIGQNELIQNGKVK